MVLVAIAVAQTPSLILAVWLGEPWLPFAVPVGGGLAAALVAMLPTRREEHNLDHRSGFLAVTLAWLSASVLGAVPFYLHPVLGLGVLDSLFESVSGFTTTGATVLSGLDFLPRSVLLWRSFEHWLGGMGMVLLGVAIFPFLGLGGMQLFKAEAPGPTKDKLTPRIAETAKILWALYLGLTVAFGVLLYIEGMTIFDAVCHAMAAVSTGGFSTHDASLGYYDSQFIHLSTAFFMLIGGTSFAVLHRALTQGIAWRDYPELRTYLGIFAVATLLITIDLLQGMSDQYPTVAEALSHAAFQSASILTTTGFVTRDFGEWPTLSHGVLFVLFFIGGMAGSTGGGVKVIRILLLVRVATSHFFQLVHPRSFSVIKLGDKPLDQAIVLSVLGFIGMWLMALLVGTVLICSFGSDLLTGFAAAAVSIGNIGPGFGGAGPANTFAHFAPGAKLTMVMLMLLGRLEIYTVLVIFTPGFWQR